MNGFIQAGIAGALDRDLTELANDDENCTTEESDFGLSEEEEQDDGAEIRDD